MRPARGSRRLIVAGGVDGPEGIDAVMRAFARGVR